MQKRRRGILYSRKEKMYNCGVYLFGAYMNACQRPLLMQAVAALGPPAQSNPRSLAAEFRAEARSSTEVQVDVARHRVSAAVETTNCLSRSAPTLLVIGSTPT
jgi:hypothetical protein